VCPGYYKSSAVSGGCSPCSCDADGTIARTACDADTGQCQCIQGESGIGGIRCDTCINGYWKNATSKRLVPNSTTRTPATNTGYEHHQRTSSQKFVDVVQHVRSRLNLFYNILPATDITNGRAHNNSTTCCTTNSPLTGKNWPHPNILTCRDVGLLHCDVANLL